MDFASTFQASDPPTIICLVAKFNSPEFFVYVQPSSPAVHGEPGAGHTLQTIAGDVGQGAVTSWAKLGPLFWET